MNAIDEPLVAAERQDRPVEHRARIGCRPAIAI
jgi:hypothetical protein